CPPTLIEHGGRRMVILWHPESVNALDPETGKVVWSVPFASRYGLTAPTPRLEGDTLFVTAFYNGSLALKLGSGTPEVLWRSPKASEKDTTFLHSIIPTPFIEDGHIYGVCSYGQLRCLRLDTGERQWETLAATTPEKETRWGNAFLIKHADRFFLFNERGELILARLTPQGYTEINRAKLLEPTNPDPGRPVVWSHPAFANQSVYARNDREIVCVSLAAP
ncbi:MAG: outer membrane protein assembly factor BamB family protein, partial [Limisphaerales bacterium]